MSYRNAVFFSIFFRFFSFFSIVSVAASVGKFHVMDSMLLFFSRYSMFRFIFGISAYSIRSYSASFRFVQTLTFSSFSFSFDANSVFFCFFRLIHQMIIIIFFVRLPAFFSLSSSTSFNLLLILFVFVQDISFVGFCAMRFVAFLRVVIRSYVAKVCANV